ncbi:ABC transporter permease [Streptomyces roseolus]|uniref:ABC transporter permease n=1 Tax=Streptomyces roseolus TaxID=67358 RepID=UPI0037035668
MTVLALSGSRWVTIRQHRRALWWALALAAVALAVMVASRLWSDAAVAALREAGCAADSTERSCYQAERDYFDSQWLARNLLGYASIGMLILPGVLGAFVAGPMLARELESGTHRLAWTQSVSPARWLAAKIAVPAALSLVVVTLLSLVFHWSWSTGPANDYPTYWYEPMMFVSYGTVPMARALLGLGLGTLAGLLVRRTVIAMGVTALAVGTALAVLAELRPGFWPVQTLTGGEGPPVSTAWRLDWGMLTASGERVLWEDCLAAPSVNVEQCMADRGGVVGFTDFHPASHYWPLQLVESGICVALAALAVLAAFRVLRARHP